MDGRMASPRAAELKKVSLFAGLSDREREFLASNLDEYDAAPGAALIREGQTNHAFFIIREGQAEVSVAGQPRRTMGPGDFFGEISMEHRVPATASVVARTPLRAYIMSHAQFRSLEAHPSVLSRLKAVMAERLLADRQATPPSVD
jgi:CRP-like cAMP-binding protein